MAKVINININKELKKIGSEFGLSTRMCFDGNEVKELERISKIFIMLNGATGALVENIPLSLAGHFVIWCNNTIYLKLKLLRSEIQSYVRLNNYNLRKINRIIEIFNSIYLCVNHIIFTAKNHIPNGNNIPVVINIPDGILYSEALRHLELFDRYNSRNYNTFDQYSWKQWFEKIESDYDSLEESCREKINRYNISDMTTWQYIRSFFSTEYWWDTITRGIYGAIPYKWKAESYEDLRKQVNKRGTIIFNRREDVQTSLDTFEQFNLTLQSELIEIREHPDSRISTPINQQRVISFSNECDRYFALIRSQMGFLQENQNFNN